MYPPPCSGAEPRLNASEIPRRRQHHPARGAEIRTLTKVVQPVASWNKNALLAGHGTAAAATLHCLTGCAIGEVAGMVIGTAAGLPNAATVVLSLVVALLLTTPINRAMIGRGKGHAVVHAYHH
jgi:Domain of unknown function (DUF4396)